MQDDEEGDDAGADEAADEEDGSSTRKKPRKVRAAATPSTQALRSALTAWDRAKRDIKASRGELAKVTHMTHLAAESLRKKFSWEWSTDSIKELVSRDDDHSVATRIQAVQRLVDHLADRERAKLSLTSAVARAKMREAEYDEALHRSKEDNTDDDDDPTTTGASASAGAQSSFDI
ncbi:hypothetical protein EBZ39_18765 [bacterium]|nr:hypothetical protein [bacterium]